MEGTFRLIPDHSDFCNANGFARLFSKSFIFSFWSPFNLLFFPSVCLNYFEQDQPDWIPGIPVMRAKDTNLQTWKEVTL